MEVQGTQRCTRVLSTAREQSRDTAGTQVFDRRTHHTRKHCLPITTDGEPYHVPANHILAWACLQQCDACPVLSNPHLAGDGKRQHRTSERPYGRAGFWPLRSL